MPDEKPLNIKGPDWIRDAMRYYMETQYPTDQPMVALSKASQTLDSRLHSVSKN